MPRAHAIPHSINILTAKLHLAFHATPSSPAAPFAASTFPLPPFAYLVSLEIILIEVSFSASLVEMVVLTAITEELAGHVILGSSSQTLFAFAQPLDKCTIPL